MATTVDTMDEENHKHQDLEGNHKHQDLPDDRHDRTKTTFFMEAAALLTIWSILVINEGAIRLVDQGKPAFFSEGRPPNALLFAAGLAEVFFGMNGLFTGMAAFIFKQFTPSVSMVTLILQVIAGYFVFIVYVFVQPSFMAADLMAPRLVGLSLGQDKFIIVLGILTSFHFCLALQGGQFVFLCRLISAGTGKDFLKQRSGNRMRAIFWNANLGLAGLWTLITGAIITTEVDGGKLAMSFMSPPNVGLLPGLTIAAGIVMIVFALIGILFVVMRLRAHWIYFAGGAAVYLLLYLNYTIVQFGLMAGPESPGFGGPIAMHGGLVYMIVFLGPYFVHLTSKEMHAA